MQHSFSFWKTFCLVSKHFLLKRRHLQKLLENFLFFVIKKSSKTDNFFAFSLAQIIPFAYLCTAKSKNQFINT